MAITAPKTQYSEVGKKLKKPAKALQPKPAKKKANTVLTMPDKATGI